MDFMSYIFYTLQSPQENLRFPGRGRALGAGHGQTVPDVHADSNLQARLLDNSSSDHLSDTTGTGIGERVPDGRYLGMHHAFHDKSVSWS